MLILWLEKETLDLNVGMMPLCPSYDILTNPCGGDNMSPSILLVNIKQHKTSFTQRKGSAPSVVFGVYKLKYTPLGWHQAPREAAQAFSSAAIQHAVKAWLPCSTNLLHWRCLMASTEPASEFTAQKFLCGIPRVAVHHSLRMH